MAFLFLPLKKTLKLSLKNTFARTIPWVKRPLNFGKNNNITYCLEKSKIKKYISNKSIISFTYALHLINKF